MKIPTFIIVAMATAAMQAQTPQEIPDSVAADTLDEVVVEAPRVVRKADMDVYHPSKSAVEHSRNGVQLLENLMIPSLSVSDALGSIKAAGEGVQLRINGRQASIDQVRALMPNTIKRVEWIDNPGLRYGGVNYVLNFVVTNPTLGGSLMADAQPALNAKWGFYMADLKLNTGKSQWQLGAHLKLTENLKISRNYSEMFTFPDGSTLSRTETPLGGNIDNSMSNIWASYNYIKPDTTVFVADFRLRQNLSDRFSYSGLLELSDSSGDILLSDSHGNKGATPTLSLYLQQSLGRKQLLVVDFSSSFYFGKTFSDYLERRPDAESYLTEIHTDIRDRNLAYAIEADYIKHWQNGRFTAGASYSANRNRSKYISLGGDVFHQRQDRVYMFAEYFHRFGRWTATAGMGVQYTDFMFRESRRGNSSWSPRPQATITYAPSPNHNFRLNFTSWQSSPTLVETNIVPQQLDAFQWRVGNQDLKTASSYMLTFRYAFNLPRVAGSFGVRAFTSPDAITPLMLWQADRLVTTYENSRGLSNISFFIAPQVEIIPDWLMASGYLQFRMEKMKGSGYQHTNNSWSGNAAIRLSHWGFTLSAQYARAQRDLWGESISWGEDFNIIDLSYVVKNWKFAAGIIMPFGKYDQGSKSLSKWNSNEQHMRLNMRMPYINISYNLQWGRQKRGADKLINADANAERSAAGGR